MSCILNIETATNVCSVAVSHNGNIVFEKENLEGPSHASLLGVFVNDAIQYIRDNSLLLDAVAVSCGPGSYTGLRIGVSEAKGICYGLGVPLIAIKTPLIMAERVVSTISVSQDTLLCPMIDARRMEVYAAIYNTKLEEVREIAADIVDENTYQAYLEKAHVLFFGNGADKCKDSVVHKNAEFIENIYPSARYMVKLSERAFNKKEFVDVAYFEPFYLKDFVTTVSKKSIL
jgi:tRNA threonylcarbamoyladenosine biosynthesis protein TsaB